MLGHQADAAGAEATARRVIEAMARPFMLDGLSFTVTCSIGIALYPNDGAGPGRAGAPCRQGDVQREGRRRRRLPLPPAAQGRGPAHAHARRPRDAPGARRGPVPPALPAAGRPGQRRAWSAPRPCCAGTTRSWARCRPPSSSRSPRRAASSSPIGEWVLVEAVRQAAQWHARGMRLVVAVNVSALQFHRPDFVDSVSRVLRESGLPAAVAGARADRVDPDPGRAGGADAAGGAGAARRAAVDRRLRHRLLEPGLPEAGADRAAQDRPQLRRRACRATTATSAIVRAIIDMGRALHLQVIAEGVETEAQRQFLQRAGCDLYQGFLFSPALDAPGFERACRQRAAAAAARPMRLVSA